MFRSTGRPTPVSVGFTLLELLVVVAILAIVGGGVIAAYDGLESKAAKGTATHSIMNLDKSIRTFRVLSTGDYPDEMDALLEATTTGPDTIGASVTSTTSNPLVSLPPALLGKFGTFALTAEMVAGLNSVGIVKGRYIGSSLTDGDGVVGNTEPGEIPSRAFDNTPRGRGIAHNFVTGDRVIVVESEGIADFGGSTPTASDRLRDIAGLDDQLQHVVVVFGIGNNSTLVKSTGTFSAGLSEAPYYTDLPKGQYGRYLALFHLASDDGSGGGTADDGAITAGEVLTDARFLAVLDTKGEWYDEEYAEYTGQKE